MGGSCNRFIRTLALSASALGACGWTNSALAQDNSAVAQEKEPPQANDDTIVVTAQKRSERLQDVPVSVAVVGGDRLDSLKLNRSTDLQYVVPGIASPEQTGPRNFGFFIRGIGTNTFSAETIEPSTAYFVDGVVMGQAGATLTDLPDIERIEVLRGPQSTLFGKNASAGVINVITRAPSKQLVVQAGISGAKPNDDVHYYGYVSGPISDTLGFSASGRRSTRQGYIRNLVDDRRFNDRDEYGFRGKLQWRPSSALTATLIGDYWKSDTNCCIWTTERFGPESPPGAPLFFEFPAIALLGTMTPGRGNQRQTIDGDVFAHIKNYGTSLQVDYDLGGGHELTSITAWRGFKTIDGLDSDSSPLDYLNVNFADLKQNQTSQELRLASPTGSVIDYVAGLYYFRQHVKDNVLQLFPFLPGTLFPPFLFFLNKSQDNRVTTTNVAAFGQINVHPTQRLVLTAGARLLNEKQKVHKDISDPTVVGLSVATTGRNKDTYLTFRGAAEYHFTPDLMAYAAVTRGYKGGGFDLYGDRPGLVFVGPEKPTAYELGLRTSFPEAGLTFNITGYYEKIDGYQTSSRDPQTLLFPIRNGNAKTKGLEAEAIWRPVGQRDFSLNLGLAYTDANWRSFTDAPCRYATAPECVGGVQDLTGEQLPFAPKWSFNIGPDYQHQLATNLKLNVTGNLNYRSSQVIGFPNSPDAHEPGYALLGGSVAIGALNDRWKVSVFGKNLTDQHFRTFQFNLSSGTSYEYRVYESRRIIGVALDVAL
jgi:iron complex outermembrane receptor protein